MRRRVPVVAVCCRREDAETMPANVYLSPCLRCKRDVLVPLKVPTTRKDGRPVPKLCRECAVVLGKTRRHVHLGTVR